VVSDRSNGSRRSERQRAERTRGRIALLVSVLLHLLFFWSLGRVPLDLSPGVAAGPQRGDFRAAKGSMQAMTLSVPPPAVPPVAKPVVTLEEQFDPVDLVEDTPLEPPPDPGDGDGGSEGPGLEDGEGQGAGGDALEGDNGFTGPRPYQAFLLPHFDGGHFKIEVLVWVDDEGKVVADSTRLNPPTDDRDFNRRVIEEAADWAFHPAMRNGVAIATWFVYSVSVGHPQEHS